MRVMGLVGLAVLALAGAAHAQPAPSTEPPATGVGANSAPTAPPLSEGLGRDLLEAARETAKATREAVDYGRVVPDVLQQILAKLDKLENKLDKIENLLRDDPAPARTSRKRER